MRLSEICLLVVFFLSLLNTTNVLAQKLIVSSYKELSTDISAREHEVSDVNDEPCALIKIYTGFTGLKIDGNRGVEKTQQQPGCLWVWVGQGTRQIKISLEGYPMLPYYFTNGLKSSNVYSIELNSDQLFSITVNTFQIEADVTLKDKKHKSNQPIENLAEGEYTIMVTKIGYKTVYDTITVNSKSIFFSYELERTKQSIMKVNTNPTGSLILIDGEVVGNSPFQGHYFPGEHRIQISLTDYASLDTTVLFEPEKTGGFTFNLRKNVGWISVLTYPTEATISIDGKVTTEKSVKLNADKNHELVVSKAYYRDYNEVFRVTSNETLTKTVSLKLAEGQLSFIVEPQTTHIKTIDRNKEERSWQGNKVIDLPTGKYALEAKVKGYKPYETEFTIAKDKKEYLRYNMEAKKLSYASAGIFSMLMPGTGQFYTQRNKVGTAFMVSTLAAAGATGYLFLTTFLQSNTYTDARDAYSNSTDPNAIPNLRTTMKNEYNKYNNMVAQRNMVMYIAGGLYVLNIIDAVVFAKYHDPNRVKKNDVSDRLRFNVGPGPDMKSGGFYVSYNF
ncbi:MAG: PEGA domain-containing protein [Salinivirgaceae bacterium]|jgi:hypothetical protein|nr:PEGA domain-containing protein [Salinivirgaceae bacterium]